MTAFNSSSWNSRRAAGRLDQSRQSSLPFEAVHEGFGRLSLRENLDHTAKSIRDDIILYLMNLKYQQVWVGQQPIEEAV